MYSTLTVATTTSTMPQFGATIQLPYPTYWNATHERVTALELLTVIACAVPKSMASTIPLQKHATIGKVMKAFQLGMFSIQINGRPIHTIADIVDIGPSSQVTLIRHDSLNLIA